MARNVPANVRYAFTAAVMAVLAASCATGGNGPAAADPGACDELTGQFVSTRERTYDGGDEGGPGRDSLRFEGDRATLLQSDTVEEGIVDCDGADVLLTYSDRHASEGEPMASGWIIATAPAPVLWLLDRAFIPATALVDGEVPPPLAISELRGRVETVVRETGYAFARDGGWRMGPAAITLAGGQVVAVEAGTVLDGGCLDPDVPDFRDTDCYLHVFVDGTGTAQRLWSGEIVDGTVRFFAPGRIDAGSRIGGVQYRFADGFAVEAPCDEIPGESPGEALARSITSSSSVELRLDPDSGLIAGIVCQLAD